jgi:hypothetical protein
MGGYLTERRAFADRCLRGSDLRERDRDFADLDLEWREALFASGDSSRNAWPEVCRISFVEYYDFDLVSFECRRGFRADLSGCGMCNESR